MIYADLILKRFTGGIKDTFTYLVPKKLESEIKIGQLVKAPLRQREVEGVVLTLHSKKPLFPVKEIKELVDPKPFLTPVQLKLALWISRYFLASLSGVIRSMTPTRRALKTISLVSLNRSQETISSLITRLKAPKQKAILSTLLKQGELERRELLKLSRATSAPLNALLAADLVKIAAKEVSPTIRYSTISSSPRKIKLTKEQTRALSIIKSSKRPALLFGVSGSGKTEI